MEGFTIEEMAEKLGISERAVYHRHHTLGIEHLTRHVLISALPGEAIPAGYPDFRPLLQRDGLILLG